MEPIVKNEIRLDIVFKLVKDNWRKFLVVVSIAFALAAVMVLCIPRYYVVSTMLAPEYSDDGSMKGALGNAATFLGVNLSSNSGEAIVPELYPYVIGSTEFLVSLMDVPVESHDGAFKGTYAEYFLTQVKQPWWTKLMAKVKSVFQGRIEPFNNSDPYKVNPFRLTKAEAKLIKSISSSIGCSVEKETGIITLNVEAQDPLIAATMTNVLKERIQDVVTNYRTAKIKEKLSYFTSLSDSAYNSYVMAQKSYAEFYDKHQGVSRQIYKIEIMRLENEMTMSFNMYNSLYQQKLMAEAELLSNTPVFTTLQNATVPVQPTGPKRKIIVLATSFLSALLYLFYLVMRNTYCVSEKKDND